MELEHDIKRLIHGKADGEIIIENETPHITGGFHKVIDTVHTGRSAFKEPEQGAIDEGSHKKNIWRGGFTALFLHYIFKKNILNIKCNKKIVVAPFAVHGKRRL